MDISILVQQVIDNLNNPQLWGWLAGPSGLGGGAILQSVYGKFQKRQEARDQIAGTILDVQRRIASISFDGLGCDINWSIEKPQWAKTVIFQDLVDRIEDAQRLAENARLGPVTVTRLRAYRDRILTFSEKWFVARQRANGVEEGFWPEYRATKTNMHEVLKSLKRLEKVDAAIKEGSVSDINTSHDNNLPPKPTPNTLGYKLKGSG